MSTEEKEIQREEEPEQQLPGQMEVVNTDMEMMEYDRKKMISGYKAGITGKLKRLPVMWEQKKIDEMLETIKRLQWELEKIKEAEE